MAIERCGQNAEGAGDDRAFDCGDNQGANGSEGEYVVGEGNRHEDRGENKAEEPSRQNPAPPPRPDAVADVMNHGGKVALLGPEVAFRAQPHGTFKLLFNALYYGSAQETRF